MKCLSIATKLGQPPRDLVTRALLPLRLELEDYNSSLEEKCPRGRDAGKGHQEYLLNVAKWLPIAYLGVTHAKVPVNLFIISLAEWRQNQVWAQWGEAVSLLSDYGCVPGVILVGSLAGQWGWLVIKGKSFTLGLAYQLNLISSLYGSHLSCWCFTLLLLLIYCEICKFARGGSQDFSPSQSHNFQTLWHCTTCTH